MLRGVVPHGRQDDGGRDAQEEAGPSFATPVTAKRAGGEAYMAHAFFALPQLSKDRVVLGGVSFDPDYLKQTFFPEVLEELIARKATEEGGNQLAMMVYPAEYEGEHADKAARRFGWLERRKARGLAQPGRGFPRAGAGHQVPGHERGGASAGRGFSRAFSFWACFRC